jgi:RNA-directed DNA polymerase
VKLIESIASKTGLSIYYLKRVSTTAGFRYKQFEIKKRNPKDCNDFRVISQPSKQVKYLQRVLIKNIFKHLPIHESVYSYKEGVNILDHAKLHLHNRYLLRIDFENFFPSIKRTDIELLLQKTELRLSVDDIKFICDLVCLNDGLTIGAPSSPILSNAVLYSLDKNWFENSKGKKITYSRYADDIYFSTNIPNILSDHLQEFQAFINTFNSPKLKINNHKSVFTSKKRKRVVTGLVLNSKDEISLGRNRKRELKALVHRYVLKALNEEEFKYLKGYLSFALQTEPQFVSALKNKYGSEVMGRIVNLESIK